MSRSDPSDNLRRAGRVRFRQRHRDGSRTALIGTPTKVRPMTERDRGVNVLKGPTPQQAHQSELFSVEPYISADYARREADALWAKVWQMACRLEELQKVGDYVTYDII